MKRWMRWLAWLLVLYLLFGFIMGLFIIGQSRPEVCTEMYCRSPYSSCEFNTQVDLGCTNESCPCTRESCPQCEKLKKEFAEVPCNRCEIIDSYFYTFIINYGRKCGGRDIFQFNGTNLVGTRYEKDESRCYNRFSFIFP